jgi:hypothetical protein
MGGEMELKTFIESTWFKGMARAAMLFGLPALMAISGYVGATLTDVRAKNDALRADVDTIQRTQQARADVNDEFQAEVATSFATVNDELKTLRATGVATQTDVALIKGILQEMQRRDTAQAMFTAPVL